MCYCLDIQTKRWNATGPTSVNAAIFSLRVGRVSSPMSNLSTTEVQMRRMCFFGVFDPMHLGHFLYNQRGFRLDPSGLLPFTYIILDSYLLTKPEEQGRPHLAIINGWTILGMWDRTGDKRPASNASFIFEGVFSLDEAKELAAKHFPVQWKRIHQGH